MQNEHWGKWDTPEKAKGRCNFREEGVVNISLGLASRLNSCDMRKLREEVVPRNSFQDPGWGKCWGLSQTGTAQEAAVGLEAGAGVRGSTCPILEEAGHPPAFLISPGFTTGHPDALLCHSCKNLFLPKEGNCISVGTTCRIVTEKI